MPSKTITFTRFTQPSSQSELLLSAENESGWTRVILGLETAGPVAVGTSADIVPVTSGRGILLPTTRDVSILLSPGDRLYIASDSINRVRVIAEPIPWLEEMAGTLSEILAAASRRPQAPGRTAPQLTKIPCPPPGFVK